MAVFAGYVRVSRVGDRAETLRSPQDQERDIRAWADRRGVKLVMLPHEIDASGRNDQRPILRGAMDQIERGELDGLAVYNFSRMTRSLRFSLDALDQIESAGGKVESVTEQLDGSTWQGRQTRNIMFSMAQGEVERQAETFDRAKEDAIKRGIYIAGKVPLGYHKADDRRLEPDPNVAHHVKRAFQMRAAGQSWQAIAQMLSDALSRPFYGPAVARIIRNRAYLGEARQGKHVNPAAHPPIVDPELWESAQLLAPKPPRGKHTTALLAGIVRCAGCSRRMTSTMIRGRREYRCRVHGAGGKCPEPAIISGPKIEPMVEETVLSYIEGLTISGAERTNRVKAAEEQLGKAEAALRAYQDATAELDDADALKHGLRTRLEAVESARHALAEARHGAPSMPAPDTVRKLWPDLSAAERNRVLAGALDVVWVKRGRGSDRVRLVQHGFASGLSTQGKRFIPRSLDWSADLPGEIRPTVS